MVLPPAAVRVLPRLPCRPRCGCLDLVTCSPALTAGVPPLERQYRERYGGQPAYEAYVASTNLLLPWPPRDKFP